MFTVQKFPSYRWFPPALALILGLVGARSAMAINYGAVTSGTWGNALTWTPSSSFPGSSDTAYIGSNSPAGSAGTATVTLGGSQSVSSLYLGYNGAMNSGTLDLAGNHLSVNSTLYFGQSGGSGTIVENGGSFSTPSLYLYSGNSLVFGASDTVTSSLNLSTSSQATTTGTGNVTATVNIDSGSKLTLGADMTLSGNLDLEDSGSTLDMGGHKLSASAIYLGFFDNKAVTVANVGPLNAGNLYVEYGSTLNLAASGTVSALTVAFSSALSTASTANVTASVTVNNGSKLTLGADMLLSGQFNLYSTGSTLDMGGNKLSASTIELGWSGGAPTLLNRGPLLAPTIEVANQPFSLSPSDSAATLNLSNVGVSTLGSNSLSTLSLSNSSALTTTSTGNVTATVNIDSGSKLTLGADMTLSGNLDLEDSGSTLDMGGHKLSASAIYLGFFDNKAVTVANVGPLNAGNLYVEYGSTLNLAASGTVSALTVAFSSALSTASTANVTASVTVNNGSKLTLGADMLLSGQFNLYSTGSTLDMGGNKLSASTIELGWSGGAPTLLNRGPLLAPTIEVANQPFSLSPSDSAATLNLSNVGVSTLGSNSLSTLSLSNSSALTTTSTGNVTATVNIDSGSKLTLGADMTLSGNLDLEDSGSTLDMGGHKLSASAIYLGFFDNKAVTVANVGPLNAGNLYVEYGSTLNLAASGTVSALTVAFSSALSTASTANVTASVTVNNGSKLTLGADMLLSGQFNLYSTGSTLDMGGNKLSASTIELGWSGGAPTLLNRGPLLAPTIEVANQPFSLSPSDSAATLNLSNVGVSTLGSNSLSTLSLSNSSALTTTSTGNVTATVNIDSGSKLTLGADMTLSGNLDLEDSGSTLDMGGHKLSASAIYLGFFDNKAVTVANVGPLNAGNLYVEYGSTLNLAASGTVSALTVAFSSALSTASTANVTASVTVNNGSKLTLGADMLLSGQFNLYSTGSTLDMGGNKLSASTIELGWSGGAPTLLNRGPLLAPTIEVANQPFSLSPSDSAATLNLSNVGVSTLGSNSLSTLSLSNSSALTTTSTGNVTATVNIDSGSKLTLGADMTLSGNLDLEDSGSTLDMGGHKLSASAIYLGFFDNKAVTVANVGPLNAGNLYVEYGSTLNLAASGTVSALTVAFSSALSTASTANVTASVTVNNGSKLTLGADMLLSGQFNLYSTGSTLDMGGNKLSASTIYLGWNGGPVSIANPGPVSTPDLYVGNGSAVPLLAAGSTVNTQMTISGNSHPTLLQPAGQLTGLTFLGSSSGALSINDTSVLQLSGGSNGGQPSWLFRWKDAGAGTWVNTLTGSIAAGRISVSSTSGYSVFDDEGYTYVATPTTLIWNGGGALDNSWSNAANWGGTTPAAGQWLRFGALAAGGHVANNNNLAVNSLFYGIFFDSAAPSFNLQGNAIDLSGDVLNQSGTNQTIGLNLELVPGDGAFNTGTITFDTDGKNITITGSISGAGMALAKTGSGILVLSGTNTYDGGTDVMAGKLIVSSTAALLDGSNLTVGANAVSIFGAAASVPVLSSAATVSPVPEPGTLLLLAAVACGATVYHRRLRSRRKKV